MQIFRSFKSTPPLPVAEEENNNFAPYVFFKGLFNDAEVNRIRAMWDQDLSKQGRIGDKALDNSVRKSNILFIDPIENDWIYNKLEMACTMINLSRYKFDLRGFQSRLQLTQYADGGFYGWHMDCGTGNTSLRKLSITVQLSDASEYAGGELQFMEGNKLVSAPKEKGMAVLFPSYVAHRVEPVTSGTRMSIVGWIAGPPYR